MNKISVSYEWLKTEPSILINGEPLDILNENLSVLRRDFHYYAPSFFKILDNYFGGEYSVDFNGTLYQCNCLKDLSYDSQYCTGINCSTISLVLPCDEVFGEISRLNAKYSVGEITDAPFTVKNTCGANIASNKVYSVVDSDTAGEKILICASNNIPSQISADLVLCPAEGYGVYKANDKYMLTMPDTEIPLFMEYYCLFTVVMPFANRVMRKLSRMDIESNDNLILTAIRKQTPQYSLGLPDSVDAGKPVPYTFCTYPGFAASRFTLSAAGPAAISLNNGNILCEKGGSYQITVKSDTGITLETKTVTAVEHCLAESIKLAPNFSFLMENTQGQINAYVTPDYAEDANQVMWSSSNPDIAHVSQSGQVVAFKAGVTIITASTKNVSAQFRVRVKKALTGYSLSQTSVQMKYNDTLTLKCIPEPYDADIDSIRWKISNPQAGTLTTYDNGFTCVYTPNPDDSSSCNIECILNNATKGQSCAVRVEGPKSHNALFVFTILLSIIGWVGALIAMIVCAVTEATAPAICLIMLLPLLLSFIGMFTHKRKRYIAFLVIDAIVFFLTIVVGAGL